ncbi:MAG: elongation factor P hydroxylase [Myxococcota bacterium]
MAPLQAHDLERVFADCFRTDYRTILVGGGAEPLYVPSSTPEQTPHRVVYREDYLASALHEVAHWCLAGPARRRLEDYGYWYAPDGRTPDQQQAFERVEARPQALEWLFSEACGAPFHLSADNLAAGLGPSESFARAVQRERAGLVEKGLPKRAERFLDAVREVGAERAVGPRS